MLLDALLAAFHHFCVFAIVALLAIEIALLASPLTADGLRRLGRIDGLYGLAAVLVLVAGFTRAVHGAKGWAFYQGNPLFWTKLAVFVVIGLLSIVPTVRFIRWRRAGGLPSPEDQRAVRHWTHAQAGLLLVLAVIAPLMARGVAN
jgi:putative membrane protein